MSISFQEAIAKGKVTPEEATALFDSLETIPTEFLLGEWKGGELATGHPSDGRLASSGWYGKTFRAVNDVDPLRYTAKAGGTFAGDPVKCVTSPTLRDACITDHQEEAETKQPGARLRVVEFRGKTSAAMVYNNLPIIDHFRKVDEDTVLGAMDVPTPGPNYFFYLQRQHGQKL